MSFIDYAHHPFFKEPLFKQIGSQHIQQYNATHGRRNKGWQKEKAQPQRLRFSV
jgi:hypothetical protein